MIISLLLSTTNTWRFAVLFYFVFSRFLQGSLCGHRHSYFELCLFVLVPAPSLSPFPETDSCICLAIIPWKQKQYMAGMLASPSQNQRESSWRMEVWGRFVHNPYWVRRAWNPLATLYSKQWRVYKLSVYSHQRMPAFKCDTIGFNFVSSNMDKHTRVKYKKSDEQMRWKAKGG